MYKRQSSVRVKYWGQVSQVTGTPCSFIRRTMSTAFAVEIWQMWTRAPVSYTHLDVYKRQFQHSAQHISEGFRAAGGYRRGADKILEAAMGSAPLR